MKPLHVATLNGHPITRWIATEMALSEGGLGEGPVLWEHSSVPYLQLISIDIQLGDGSVYRMQSQLDDGSEAGHFGLYLLTRDAMENPRTSEMGSIYRTRELRELPVGAAVVTVTETDGPNAVVRMETGFGGATISFWAAEVDERDGGCFEILGPDESILVQVDGKRPAKKRSSG